MTKEEAETIIKQACALVVANLETHQRIQTALEVAFAPEPLVETTE